MVRLRMGKDPRALQNAAGFRIARPEVEAVQTGVGNCLRAHRTRFQRDPERASFQPFRSKGCAGLPDRQYLGVGRWVIMFPSTVPGAGQHRIPSGDDGPDRNFAAFPGGAGF